LEPDEIVKTKSQKMLRRTCSLIFWTLLRQFSSCANFHLRPITDPENGYTYYLTSPSTWTEAEADAVSIGGNLATINSSADNAWVFSTFSDFAGQPRNLWTGLYSTIPNDPTLSDYQWVSGEPVVYTNFALGEPNILGQYVNLIGPGITVSSEWNNDDNVSSDGYTGYGPSNILSSLPTDGVVEVTPTPEPSTWALLLGGIGVLALMHRRIRRTLS
jgi:hypothetical protein